MGVRSITRGTPIPDGPNSTGSNQSKRKRPYFGTEVELEHGADWEDSHIGNRNDGPTYTVRVGPNDSREHLRDDGEQTGNPGIYKHTNFVISRSHPSIETEVWGAFCAVQWWLGVCQLIWFWNVFCLRKGWRALSLVLCDWYSMDVGVKWEISCIYQRCLYAEKKQPEHLGVRQR